MKCKEWGNRRMCTRKLHFMMRLPFSAVRLAPLAEKLATARLCSGCAFRMFVLPRYASNQNSARRLETIWKNRHILSSILGEEHDDPRAEVKAPMLMFALMRPKGALIRAQASQISRQGRKLHREGCPARAYFLDGNERRRREPGWERLSFDEMEVEK